MPRPSQPMSRPPAQPLASKAAPQRLTIGVLFGFRALMVLLVCNYHIWQLSWLSQSFMVFGVPLNVDFITRSAYLMVDGMLLLSGLLLYLPYAREVAEGTPAPGIGRFYGARLSRILPSYLLSVLVILFFVALPQGKYADNTWLGPDIITHLTFTFNFWRETYLYTPLNGALWTVAVEMQFYLIFPLLARAAQKKPALTLLLMTLAGLGYRLVVYTSIPENAILINQMVGFLDVYALGMLGAMLYVRWQQAWAQQPQGKLSQALAAVCFLAGLYAVGALLRVQSAQGVQGVEVLRLSQLMIRLPFALSMLAAMLGAALMPRFLQKLLDNRLMRFLALISFNMYIWHQPLSALMAKFWYPSTLHDDPNLQRAYTVACLCVTVVVGMAATFGVEQPLARRANQWIKKRSDRHERPENPATQPPADPVLLRAQKGRAAAD